MSKKMNLRVEGRIYKDVTIEDVNVIQVLLAKYGYSDIDTKVAETVKNQPTKDIPKVKVYDLCKDGKSVTIGGNGFIPKKVFNGVTYSLKQSGAKYDGKTKAWSFNTKADCKAWCKAQDERG